jgi:glycosyltransferase involved in cell wall biosynthesis
MHRVSRIAPAVDLPPDADASSGPSQSSITVVIPTYNRVSLLPQTLETVFAQRPTPAEVIVVDDGSTDGTGEYLESVDVSMLKNQEGGWGPARARNEGFRRVKSDLVAFLDSDDLLLPGALSRLEGALERAPMAPFAFGRCLTARKVGERWSPTGLMTAESAEMIDPLLSLFTRNYVPSVGSVARALAIEHIGGYPETTSFAEDHYFWLRLAQLGDPVFAPSLTSVYRVHAGNRHSPILAANEVDKYLAIAEKNPRLAAEVPARLGVVLCNSVTGSLSGGDLRGALRALRKNLLKRRSKVEILRCAYRHWRARRRWAREGVRLWEGDAELRDWLARH